MNLKINHSREYKITVAQQLSIDSEVLPKEPQALNSHHDSVCGTVMPELVSVYNEWHIIISCWILLFTGMILFPIVDITVLTQGPITSKDIWAYVCILAYVCSLLLLCSMLIKNFSGIRYLLFQGERVILQGRWVGRRVYAAKDLKFHLLSHYPDDSGRWTLEIELPDRTIPESKRLFIAECAAQKSTMDGMLNTLFPLLRGESSILETVKPRGYERMPFYREVSPFRHYINLQEHIYVWLIFYKVNQFLFWLVHGGPDKVLEIEKARIEAQL